MNNLKTDKTFNEYEKNEQTMLQQFITNQVKTKLSTNEIIALMVDFLLAGITTVIKIP